MDDLRLVAVNPNTSPALMMRLATENPELRPLLASNPSAYDALRGWLAGLGDPAVDQALAVASDPNAPLTLAGNPMTSQHELLRLATDHPETRIAIALNPSTFGGLLKWLGSLGDPRINAALDLRRSSAKRPDGNPVAGSSGKMNTTAIVAFVLAFFASLPAVILGHIALSQIKKSGESGSGLAIAGLFLGYIGIVATVVAVIYLIVAAAR